MIVLKRIICILLVLVSLMLSACGVATGITGGEETDESETNITAETGSSLTPGVPATPPASANLTESEPTESNYGLDFPPNPDDDRYVIKPSNNLPFPNAQVQVDFSEVILIGKVTGISFRVEDISTALNREQSPNTDFTELQTYYTIDVITVYKGTAPESTRIRALGGAKDYRVEEQFSVIKTAGFTRHRRGEKLAIFIVEDNPDIRVGDVYLFALYPDPFVEQCYSLQGKAQTAYSLSNPFMKKGNKSILNDDPADYGKQIDDYISAYEIIRTFGQDKWDSFWTWWQKENPGWESRIDKKAVDKVLAQK